MYEEIEVNEEASPCEDDLFTEDGSTFVYCGKVQFRCGKDCTEEEVWERVEQWMDDEQYWPNVWMIEERGGYSLMVPPHVD
jgi:hypothetical protein